MACCINPFVNSPSLKLTINRCGFLMLISHLISTKMEKQLRLADELLKNIHRNRIAVNPPSQEAALEFIFKMIELASQNRSEWDKDTRMRANHLLEAAKELQQKPGSPNVVELFERYWNEFCILYLKNELKSILEAFH